MTRAEDSEREADDLGADEAAYTTRFPGEHGDLPSTSVIVSVAEATGREPTRLRPLHDVIDADALDRLLGARPDRSTEGTVGVVTFRYEGCDVSVHADGRTVVVPRSAEE